MHRKGKWKLKNEICVYIEKQYLQPLIFFFLQGLRIPWTIFSGKITEKVKDDQVKMTFNY